MDLGSLVISMASMGGLGALFSVGLAIASKKLHVEEDPRISLLLEALPGANCGGCGYPGCANFAENVANQIAPITGCPVNTQDAVEELAEIMGVIAEAAEKKVARVLCLGGHYEAAKKGDYLGIQTCVAAHITRGGEKLCSHGCLGLADCVRPCPFDAIHMNENGLPVVIDEKCTGCGNCAIACPRDVIEIHPESRNLFIFCKSTDETKFAKTTCIRACLGCKACAKGAGEGNIIMENNLAKVNYENYGCVDQLPTDKCPNGAILVIGKGAQFETVDKSL